MMESEEKKTVEEQEKLKQEQRESIENEIEVLKQQRYRDETEEEDRRMVVNRYQRQMEDAVGYYRGQEANTHFWGISQGIEDQRRNIRRESNQKYEEREEKIAHLRRIREEV